MGPVSSPEPIAPSRRLRSAAEAERERLGRELERLDERAERLQSELQRVDATRAEMRDQLALLARLSWHPDTSAFPTARTADRAAHLQAVPADGPPAKTLLRGARIRETAVLLLASSANPTRPIHYQQWYKLLRAAGFGIDAQDPQATFLTQISRSPVVRRVDAPGIYALDFDAASKLRQRLRRLETQLAQLPTTGETAEEIGEARTIRNKLTNELRGVERQLEEALKVAGEGPKT